MDQLDEFEGVRVLCIGDLLFDRFIHGSVNRISPESPVPVVLLGATESVPGGAGNVARNISALGGRCCIIGAVGEDSAGHEMIEMLSACTGVTVDIVSDTARPTIEKVRYVAQGQHILRVDREDARTISDEVAGKVIARVDANIGQCDVVILSDYAKGLLVPSVVTHVIARARAIGVPVIVDPKTEHLDHYRGATVVTPNAKEATAATGIAITDAASAERASEIALDRSGIDAILLTRAERGMSLMTRDRKSFHIPASARDVFDVVGAGDTVVATLAVSLGAGLSLEDAAHLANAAAGLVVGKRGTATVTRTELHDELTRLNGSGLSSSGVKHFARPSLHRQVAAWRRDGLRIGFTNGCFDIVHAGHVRILEFARANCDRLVVGLNSDASVSRLKGPTRPVVPEDDRALLLSAMTFVDAVVIFTEDTPEALIEEIEPDVLIKGADYKVEQVVGGEAVLKRGGKVLLFDLLPGRSTSTIIAQTATSKTGEPVQVA